MIKITARPYFYSFLILFLILGLSIAVGSVTIPFDVLLKLFASRLSPQFSLSGELQRYATIIFDLRLPRTLLIAFTGAALAGSGGAYQGLFRNPLADPYLIGVASGAGLGAVTAMAIQWPDQISGMFFIPAAAFLGALITVFLVYQLARVRNSIPTSNLILAGVAISAFASALTSFLMLHSTDELRRAIVWLMGGAAMSGWKPVLTLLPYLFIGLTFLILQGHKLNILQFGDEQAQQMGLQVSRARRSIVITASLTTAAAVAFSGTIGFIGLVVPHIVRMIWGGDYRRLIPISIINGASMLLIADILSRIVIAPQELPVGIITALGGAPFFLWLLKRSKQQNYW
ncbi:MAG: iron ABC transporter permease [Anaerolineaceae bacterium]|nr:iron ABC transporter permease [Anaerolineaceae bacterium]